MKIPVLTPELKQLFCPLLMKQAHGMIGVLVHVPHDNSAGVGPCTYCGARINWNDYVGRLAKHQEELREIHEFIQIVRDAGW